MNTKPFWSASLAMSCAVWAMASAGAAAATVACPPCLPVASCVPAPACAYSHTLADPVRSSYATLFKTTPEGLGERLGTVVFTDRPEGLEIDLDLAGLPPGEHGFHVHEKPDCSAKAADGTAGPALAAGGHYDPAKTGKHLGPNSGGHKGDLPRLFVAADGTARGTMVVKGLTAWEVKYRSLMIHAGGDNYSDQPSPLGGGGARIACGIIM